MPSTTISSKYDTFARIINESWGPEVSESVFPFIDKILPKLTPNANILDLCCGAGHLAKKLLDRGYQVTGIDASREVLRYAEQNAPDGKFMIDDARFFNLPSTFQCVVSTDYGLNHITNIEELTSVFKNVYTALRSNGLFVFDLSLDDRYQSSWNNSMLGDVRDEYAWALMRSYDPRSRIGEINITVFQLTEQNWQRLDDTWSVKGYLIEEVISALKSVDFTQVDYYNSDRDVGTVYFVCAK